MARLMASCPSKTVTETIFSSEMSHIDTYRQFCANLGQVPLFLQPDWWDAAAGPNRWDVALVRKGNQLIAAMPYLLQQKFGMNTLLQPTLTPYTGWLIDFPEGQKAHSRQSFSHEVVGTLVEQLPKYARLHLRLYPQQKDLLPWIWAGAKAQVRYTYQLDIHPDESQLMGGLRENLRRALRSTENWSTNRAGSGSSDVLYSLKADSYRNKGLMMPISKPTLQRIVGYLIDTEQGALLTTSPSGEEPAGALLLAFDRDTCIYLAGASAPGQRNSGASTRLLWEGIRLAKEMGCKIFDFEGSMVPSIEHYFRAFNGDLVPYYELAHNRSIIMKVRDLWR